MAVTFSQYIKNVSKSVVYASVDKVKNISPTIADYADTNKEVVTEVYSTIRNFRSSNKKITSYIEKSKIYEALDTGRKSLIENIRTGDWYSKNTELSGIGGDNFNNFGDIGMDLDIGIDFGSDNWDEDDSNSVTGGDKVVASAIVRSNNKSTTELKGTIVDMAEATIEADRRNTSMMYTQSLRLYSMQEGQFNAMNSNMGNILNFMTSNLQTHLQNSTTYFTETTNLLKEQNTMLKKIMDQIAPDEKRSSSSSDKVSVSDLFSSNGALDLSNYAKYVKQNVSSSLGVLGSLNSMMGEDTNMLQMILSTPMRAILGFGINALFPKNIEKSMKSFDKTLSGFAPTMLSKMTRYFEDSSNPIMNFMGGLFGIKPKNINKLDASKYEKGRVPWDGKSKKALEEVIPTQLSKIISLLSGKGERVFDYDTGTWKNASKIKEERDEDEKRYVRMGMGDMYDFVMDNIRHIKFSSKDEFDSMKNSAEALFNAIFNNDKGEYRYGNYDRYKSIIKDKTQYQTLDAIMKAAPTWMRAALVGDTLDAKNSRYNSFQYKMKNGGGLDILLDNGFNIGEFSETTKDKKINRFNALSMAVDDKGKNIFYYLQHIYTLLYNRGGSATNRYDIRAGRTGKTIDEIISENDPKITKPGELTPEEKAKRDNESFLTSQKYIVGKDGVQYGNFSSEQAIRDNVATLVAGYNLREAEDDRPVIDKIIDFIDPDKKRKGIRSFRDLLSKPGEFVSGIFERGENFLNRLMFEEPHKVDGSYVKGIFGLMTKRIGEFGTKVSKFIEDKIINPIADFFDKKKLSKAINGFLGHFGIDIDKIKNTAKKGSKDLISNTGKSLKAAGNWVKDGVVGIRNRFTTISTNANERSVANAADATVGRSKGGLITETQQYLIDKGEAVIYNGSSDMNLITSKGQITLSSGDLVLTANVLKDLKKNDGSIKTKMQIIENFIRKRGITDTTEVNSLVNKYANIRYSKLPMFKKGKSDKKVRNIIKRARQSKTKSDSEDASSDDDMFGIDTVIAKFTGTIDKALGAFDIKDEDRKKVGDIISDTTEKAFKYAPTALAGGVIGGGVSILTGLLGGPLLGAAVGAGISIATRSERIQDILFGKAGKDGERAGGIFSKETKAALDKYAKPVLSGGAAGIGASLLLPGGPVMGAIVGSAIGFASKNEMVQSILFGDENLDNGVFSKASVEKFKKSLPRTAALMVPSLLLGPFGIVGNAAMATGLGLLSSSTKTGEFLFGTKNELTGKNEGGLLPTLRNRILSPLELFMRTTGTRFNEWMSTKIFDPIAGAIKPIAKQLSAMGSSLGNGVKWIGNIIGSVIGKLGIARPIARFADQIVHGVTGTIKHAILNPALHAAGFIASRPSAAIGAIGSLAKRRQLHAGNIGGRIGMGAQEANRMIKSGEVKYSQYADQIDALANMTDEDIKKYSTEYSKVIDTVRYRKTAKQDLEKEISGQTAQIRHLNDKIDTNKLHMLISKKDKDGALKYLDKIYPKDEDINKARDVITKIAGADALKTVHDKSDIAKIIRDYRASGKGILTSDNEKNLIRAFDIMNSVLTIDDMRSKLDGYIEKYKEVENKIAASDEMRRAAYKDAKTRLKLADNASDKEVEKAMRMAIDEDIYRRTNKLMGGDKKTSEPLKEDAPPSSIEDPKFTPRLFDKFDEVGNVIHTDLQLIVKTIGEGIGIISDANAYAKNGITQAAKTGTHQITKNSKGTIKDFDNRHFKNDDTSPNAQGIIVSQSEEISKKEKADIDSDAGYVSNLKDKSDSSNDIIQKEDKNGNIKEYTRTSSGKLVEVKGSKSNTIANHADRAKNEEKSANILNTLTHPVEATKEKGKSLLNGFIGKVASFATSPIGLALSTFLVNTIAPGLLGKIGEAVASAVPGVLGMIKDAIFNGTTSIANKTGLTNDSENGNYIKDSGKRALGVAATAGPKALLYGASFTANALRPIKSTASLLGKAAKKVATAGSTTANIGEKAAASTVGKAAGAKEGVSGLIKAIDKIDDVIMSIASNMTKIPLIGGKIGNILEKIVYKIDALKTGLSKFIESISAKLGGNIAATTLKTAFKIVMTGTFLVYGYTHADQLLGIKRTNTIQKVMASLIYTVWSLLPTIIQYILTATGVGVAAMPFIVGAATAVQIFVPAEKVVSLIWRLMPAARDDQNDTKAFLSAYNTKYRLSLANIGQYNTYIKKHNLEDEFDEWEKTGELSSERFFDPNTFKDEKSSGGTITNAAEDIAMAEGVGGESLDMNKINSSEDSRPSLFKTTTTASIPRVAVANVSTKLVSKTIRTTDSMIDNSLTKMHVTNIKAIIKKVLSSVPVVSFIGYHVASRVKEELITNIIPTLEPDIVTAMQGKNNISALGDKIKNNVLGIGMGIGTAIYDAQFLYGYKNPSVVLEGNDTSNAARIAAGLYYTLNHTSIAFSFLEKSKIVNMLIKAITPILAEYDKSGEFSIGDILFGDISDEEANATNSDINQESKSFIKNVWSGIKSFASGVKNFITGTSQPEAGVTEGAGGATLKKSAIRKYAKIMDKYPGHDGVGGASLVGDDDFLGKISAKYEVSYPTGNADRISNTKGDAGGKSYGIPQFATNTGSADAFVQWLKTKNPTLGNLFGNFKAGTSDFDAAWKAAYSQDPNTFRKLQTERAAEGWFSPFVSREQSKLNIDFNRSRALQEAAYSTAIQYGSNTNVFENALTGKDGTKMSDEELINTLYDYKYSSVNSKFSKSSESVREGVRNRILNEKNDLLALAKDPSAKVFNVASSGSYSDSASGSSMGPTLSSGTTFGDFLSDLAQLKNIISGSTATLSGGSSNSQLGHYNGTLTGDGTTPADNWFTNALNAHMSSPFLAQESFRTKPHEGIDYGTSGVAGAGIPSPVEGEVTINKNNPGGYGNYAVVKDIDGEYHLFGHMKDPSPIPVGAKVKPGDILGYVGSTGASTGPHLHYGVSKDSLPNKYNKNDEPNAYLSKYFKKHGTPNASGETTEENRPAATETAIGGDSLKITNNILKQIKDNQGKSNKTIRSKDEGKGGADDTMTDLVKIIVELLKRVVENTGSLAEIVNLLSKDSKVELSDVQKKKLQKATDIGSITNILTSGTYDSKIQSSDSYILQTLQRLATE